MTPLNRCCETNLRNWQRVIRNMAIGVSPSCCCEWDTLSVADAGGDQIVPFRHGSDGTLPYDPLSTGNVLVTFDGSNSHDPDNPANTGNGITAWDWSVIQPSGLPEGSEATHLYTAPGKKTVSLTVTDDDTPALMDKDDIEVTILSITPVAVIDGKSAELSVLHADDVTAWSWSALAPTGAWAPNEPNNVPSVTFADPTVSTAVIPLAKWFALPNRNCQISINQPGASLNSTYTVTSNVTLPSGNIIAVSTNFTVILPAPGGGVGIEFNNLTSYIGARNPANNNRWEYFGLGLISRGTTSLSDAVYVPTTSQFYNKIARHEQKHIDQFLTGIASQSHSLANLETWLNDRKPSNPNAIVPDSEKLYASSQVGLDEKVESAVKAFVVDQSTKLDQPPPRGGDSLSDQMEREAYHESDMEAPHYVYENCGRY